MGNGKEEGSVEEKGGEGKEWVNSSQCRVDCLKIAVCDELTHSGCWD